MYGVGVILCRATFLEMDLTLLAVLLSEQCLCICCFHLFPSTVSKNITQGQTKDRQPFKKGGKKERKGGRKEGAEGADHSL